MLDSTEAAARPDAAPLPCVARLVRAHRLSMPLTVPYKLAMGAVASFDTILVEVLPADGGAPGWGEATILTGYTDETVEEAWDLARCLAKDLAGLSGPAGGALLEGHFARAPFTVSAFRSAFEFAADPSLLCAPEQRRVPLLAGINATDPEGIEREMEAAITRGFRTLKIKVGFDAAADAKRLRLIQRINRGRTRLRVDGNQGFRRDEACAFAAGMDPDSIELLEQPCDSADWEGAVAVAAVSTVPLMMDESIYGPDDIRRAAELGCARFVKLKLMKMGGIAALEDGLSLIRSLGMEPVLGNGVATEVGCWAEAAVAHRLVANAGEFNGFLRPRARLLAAPLMVERGEVVLPPCAIAPSPDPTLLCELRTDFAEAARTS